MKENCQTCNDPTKYISGFWDGAKGTSGQMFDCNNLNCEIKQGRNKAINTAEEERAARIIRSKLDGSYKNDPKITLD